MFSKNRNITIFLSIAALMLWGNIGMTQTVWEKYSGNPVLDVGPAAWDNSYVFDPVVIFDGTEYKMWYTGQCPGCPYKIGLATSVDGIVWNKHPDNPVLDVGLPGIWDDYHVLSPTVIFDGTEYKMWYSGCDGSQFRIGYATSTDGIVWNKHPDPVLDIGPDAWDNYYLFDPTVIFDGTEYKMWYVGGEGPGDPPQYKIGLATSADGVVWEKHPDNPVLDVGSTGTWDDHRLYDPTVLFDGSNYEMWYMGHGPYYRIGYATSPDGINWDKYPDNPVLDKGASGEWDDINVSSPTVLFEDNKYKMWYSGYDGSYHRIGYATSIPDAGSINGTVTDMAGNPIKFAFVIAIKPIKKWTLTKPDGYYEITDLEPGDYLVLAIKKGYKAGFARVTVEAGQTTTQDFQLKPKSGEDDEDEFPALSNFPNPFNPDTWIPYYLPQDADVTIQIYNSAGQLVRILNMGNQAAGVYLDKEQAAYWDGKDSLGQRVGSGVYFYTLQAGGFRATKKMIVLK